MAHAHEITTQSIRLTDDQGHAHDVRLAVRSNLPAGWCQIEICEPGNGNSTGAVEAIPVRLKMSDSGGRIAADFPGCDPNVVIVDGEGHITNG